MNKKILIPIIAAVIAVILAIILITVSGGNDTALENPPVENTSPVVENEPAQNSAPSEPEKTEPSPEPEKEPEKEPVEPATTEPSAEPEPSVEPEPEPSVEPEPEQDNSEHIEEEVKTEEIIVDPFTEVNETVYATGTVNIRLGYNTNSTKLGSLNTGDSITRIGLGTDEAAGWSRVVLSDGTTAYVSSKYLSLTKPVIQNTTPTPTPSTTTNTETDNQETPEVIPTPPSNTQQSTSNTAGSDPDYDPKYDYDGDGKLNSAEEAMRDLDAWSASQTGGGKLEDFQHAFNPVQST